VKKSKQDVFEATACIDYRNEGESSPLYTYPVLPNLAIALCNPLLCVMVQTPSKDLDPSAVLRAVCGKNFSAEEF